MQPQRNAEVLDHLNGSRIIFSGTEGPRYHSPADLTQDVVVISPGLPTPPRSPSHRQAAGEQRSSEVNGGGPPVLSFGCYYGQSQSAAAAANGDCSGTAAAPPRSARPEERLVKFSGIGPVDETGMPIASRSSVNKPKDWYRSMFRQIHKKAAELEMTDPGLWSADGDATPRKNPPAEGAPESQQSDLDAFTLSSRGALPDWTQLADGNKPSDWRRQHREPRSIYDFEPGQGTAVEGEVQGQRFLYRPPAKPHTPSIEAMLVSELSRFEAELDSDIQGLERRLSQKRQRRARGEGPIAAAAQVAERGPGTRYVGKDSRVRDVSRQLRRTSLTACLPACLRSVAKDFFGILLRSSAFAEVGGSHGSPAEVQELSEDRAAACGHTMALTVTLTGPSPWGFRISGGRDFKKAVTVSKVNAGSKAEQASLLPGDVIKEINGENTAEMLNVEAQNKIKNSKTQLLLVVERPEPTSPMQTNGIGATDQLSVHLQETLQVSRDENQNYREYSFSSPASLSPGPYSPLSPSSPDRKAEKQFSNSTRSFQVRSWSPVEKISSHRVSRPLSQPEELGKMA
ncbi:vinexin-like isoform X2 [Arapaima gigas]